MKKLCSVQGLARHGLCAIYVLLLCFVYYILQASNLQKHSLLTVGSVCSLA